MIITRSQPHVFRQFICRRKTRRILAPKGWPRTELRGRLFLCYQPMIRYLFFGASGLLFAYLPFAEKYGPLCYTSSGNIPRYGRGSHMNVEELKARLRALLHQRDSLPLSRWIGLRDDALESLHLWRLLFSGHGLKDDKMFWSLRAPLL